MEIDPSPHGGLESSSAGQSTPGARLPVFCPLTCPAPRGAFSWLRSFLPTGGFLVEAALTTPLDFSRNRAGTDRVQAPQSGARPLGSREVRRWLYRGMAIGRRTPHS